MVLPWQISQGENLRFESTREKFSAKGAAM